MDMLPSCVLQSVFAFVDAPTLLTSVHLVSKTFHDAVRSEYLWLARLPTELAHALRSSGPGTSAGNGSALQLYLLLANSNLLSNPWQTLQQQTAERQAAIMPGRAKTPWVAMGDNSQTWKWGPAALEGLTTVPGAEPPMPPPPPPPLLSRVGAAPTSWHCSMPAQLPAALPPCLTGPAASTLAGRRPLALPLRRCCILMERVDADARGGPGGSAAASGPDAGGRKGLPGLRACSCMRGKCARVVAVCASKYRKGGTCCCCCTCCRPALHPTFFWTAWVLLLHLPCLAGVGGCTL